MQLVSSDHKEVYYIGAVKRKIDFYSDVAEFGKTLDINVYVSYSKITRPPIKRNKLLDFRTGKSVTREVVTIKPGDWVSDSLSSTYFGGNYVRYPTFVKDTDTNGVETRRMFPKWPIGRSITQNLTKVDPDIVEMLKALPGHVRSVLPDQL